jgi:glucose-6-phosphate dehydrogenase assembly protein OpcA
MAFAMEGAKLVAGWLAQRWRVTAPVWFALPLAAPVTGLAVINATGVYAQLVAAHVGEHGSATSAIEMQDAALAVRVEVAAHAVADQTVGWARSIQRSRKRPSAAGPRPHSRPSRLCAKTREVLAAQRQREGKALADLSVVRSGADEPRPATDIEGDLKAATFLPLGGPTLRELL